MVLIGQDDMGKIAPLFARWEETMIFSCLQGYMGTAFADCKDMPQSALIEIGDFAFCAGIPNADMLRELNVIGREAGRELAILVPKSEDWETMIESVFSDAEKISRYAIKKEKDIFNRDKLAKMAASLPVGVTLKQIDSELYETCLLEGWSRDFVSVFQKKEEFLEKGLGFVAVLDTDGTIVSGASSYSVYQDGIEIEVDTKQEFRGQGLASACAARLMLECFERGWYPSWDAATKVSVALAEKLGYHFDREYRAYHFFMK